MTTKEILERLSLIVDQFVDLGVDPWNLPVKVLLKEEVERKAKEYNVSYLSNKLYNCIVVTKSDTPMTFKEFIAHMMIKPEEYYWYVRKEFTLSNSPKAYITSINGYYGTIGNEICIAAKEGGKDDN